MCRLKPGTDVGTRGLIHQRDSLRVHRRIHQHPYSARAPFASSRQGLKNAKTGTRQVCWRFTQPPETESFCSPLRYFAGGLATVPQMRTLSKFPVSSNEPMPSLPHVNVLFVAVITGFFKSSKKTSILPLFVSRTTRTM